MPAERRLESEISEILDPGIHGFSVGTRRRARVYVCTYAAADRATRKFEGPAYPPFRQLIEVPFLLSPGLVLFYPFRPRAEPANDG